MYSMWCPSAPSSIKKYCACMEDLVPSSTISNKFLKLSGPSKSPTKVYFVTCSGPTLKRECLAGARTNEEWASFLAATLSRISWRNTTWIWFVGPIRSWKRVMSSLLRDNWWQFSVPQTTAGSSTTQEHWWALMKTWCARFKSWSLPSRRLPRCRILGRTPRQGSKQQNIHDSYEK